MWWFYGKGGSRQAGSRSRICLLCCGFVKREQAWPFATLLPTAFRHATKPQQSMYAVLNLPAPVPQNRNKACISCCPSKPSCSHATKPQQSMHSLQPVPACLLPCHKNKADQTSPRGLPLTHLICRVTHWHSESTNCRSKYVTLLPLSIKKWEELKQEVAKILLQTVGKIR